jgi:hypothetical protein
MKYTIDVTQEDIDHGHRSSCLSCPVARAVGRALAADYPDAMAHCGPWNLRMVGEDARFGEGDGIVTLAFAHTPPSVRHFMRDFDAGDAEHLTPFSFTVDFKDLNPNALRNIC